MEGIEKRAKHKKEDIIERDRSVWTEEGIEHYHEECKDWKYTQTEIGKIWEEMRNKMKYSIMKITMKVISRKLGKMEWHSKEWKEKKKGDEKRKEYRKWCEEEKERLRREEEERIKAVRTEEEAWKYINKYRKKREGVGRNIGINGWKEHFMQLLEGAEDRVVLEEEEDGGEKEKEKKDSIGKEELVRHLTK